MSVMPMGDYKGQPLENLPSRYMHLLLANNQFKNAELRLSLLKVLTKRAKETRAAERNNSLVLQDTFTQPIFQKGTVNDGLESSRRISRW